MVVGGGEIWLISGRIFLFSMDDGALSAYWIARFTPEMLMEQVPNAGLVVDLTATNRYYNGAVIEIGAARAAAAATRTTRLIDDTSLFWACFFLFCFGVSRCSPSAASGTSRSSAPARRCLATATSNSKRCSSVFLLLLLSLSLLLLLLLLLLMLLFSVVLRSHRWRSGTATHSSSQLEVYSLAPLMGEFVYFRSGYTLKGSDVFTGGRTTRRIPPLFHSVRRWYGTASRDVEISVPLREADQLVIGCIRHGKRARTRPWSLVPSMIMRSRKVLHLQLLLCIHVHIDGNVQ